MPVKKAVSVAVVAALLAYESSCLMGRPSGFQKTVKIDVADVNPLDTKARIVNVITKSGDNYAFAATHPARILPDGQAVAGRIPKVYEFAKERVLITYAGKGKTVSRVETADGRIHEVLSATETADTIMIRVDEEVRIPFPDIQQVWVRRTDTKTNIGVLIAVLAVSGIVGHLLVESLQDSLEENFDSCPFIYSYDGEAYALDAEPYGLAVSEGLERLDWIELSRLREVDGKFRLLLANELDETQCTDELKVVTVDHAPDVRVAPDAIGVFHTFSRPAAPSRAVDGRGRDILKFVAENDLVFWVSPLEEKSAEDPVMRDELVFEFPKPAGGKSAKLLANVWATTWTSRSSRLFLELFGSSLEESRADVDRRGPLYWQFLKWLSDEELYMMKIWVETPSGWRVRGILNGGAPAVTKDKACLLDVGDVPGDTLRIKLRPPVNFWMVNSLAVDYGPDSPVRLTELAAERAVDPGGRDVRAELAATDRAYLESREAGERTELVFAAPPTPEGLARTVFVKASGYYRAHIEARGEPRTELIGRLLGEPDFAARYSLREYLRSGPGLKTP
jgi:hypothetical protein